MHTNSIEAYDSIKPELSPKRREVLKALKSLGEATDKEIAKFLHWDRCCVTGRRGELENSGFIESCGQRKVQNRNHTIWRLKKI